MSDTLATRRTFRTLSIAHDAARECLAIEMDDDGLASHRQAWRSLDRVGTGSMTWAAVATSLGAVT